MRVEDVFKFLQGLGLNESEAKAYATLSVAGPMKAGSVSKESGVPQSKIYWVLEDLIEKQLVEVCEGTPKEYKAVAPEVALRRLLEEREKSMASARVGLREVSQYLKPVKGNEMTGGIWTIRGRNWLEFFNKASEMVGRSRKYVYAVTRDFSKSARLAEMVHAAARKGVKVRALGMVGLNKENFFRAKWYLEHGVEIRIVEAGVHPRIVVVDGREVLLRLDHEHAKKEGFPFSSIWSEDPSLVAVFDTYVRNMWDGARSLDIQEIEKIMADQ